MFNVSHVTKHFHILRRRKFHNFVETKPANQDIKSNIKILEKGVKCVQS